MQHGDASACARIPILDLLSHSLGLTFRCCLQARPTHKGIEHQHARALHLRTIFLWESRHSRVCCPPCVLQIFYAWVKPWATTPLLEEFRSGPSADLVLERPEFVSQIQPGPSNFENFDTGSCDEAEQMVQDTSVICSRCLRFG